MMRPATKRCGPQQRREAMYVAQLLPDLEQARVLRDALTDYLKRDDLTDEQRDAAIALQLKLVQDMRRNRDRNG